MGFGWFESNQIGPYIEHVIDSSKANSQDVPLTVMEGALEAHLKGHYPREELVGFLKWEMAAAGRQEVWNFLSGLQENQNLDVDLVDEVTRTFTENVQWWDFPEEPQLIAELVDSAESSIPEVIQSVYRASMALIGVRNMLTGVNVRLNLRGLDAAIGEGLRLVMEELLLLEVACEHVGTGTLLAPGFPGVKGDGQAAWSSPGGAPLSPKQIIWLADLGRESPEVAVTYAQGISAHTTPPQLVTERIRATERHLISAERNREVEEEMRKAMALTCPRCNSAPGALCRSSSGKETTTHKGRYALGSGGVN